MVLFRVPLVLSAISSYSDSATQRNYENAQENGKPTLAEKGKRNLFISLINRRQKVAGVTC